MQQTCEKPECIAANYRANKAKLDKEYDKKVIKQMKENVKKHSEYENDLQKIINAITSAIDKGMNCICCNAKIHFGNPANAGHRWSVGSNNSIRFNLHNIHRNGVCCNKHKGGNPDGYDEGLIRIYGKDYFEYVKFNMKPEYKLVKLTVPEIKALKVLASSILRDLKKLDKEYSPSERLELRDKFNKEIGIYKEWKSQ